MLNSPLSISVRLAVQKDADRLLEMVHSLARFHNDNATPTISDLERDLFGPQPWATALVAEMESAIVGYSVLCPLLQLQFATRGMDIHHLFVEPAQRGIGVGRHLIKASISEATRQGCKYVVVGTHPDNRSAQDIYVAAGFEAAAPPGPRFKIRL